MTRLTGTDALGLMEAYNAVYEPQEITEEEIQKNFEELVYSLVEEGYDLSDYTWDEIYESYLQFFNEEVSPVNQRTNQAIGNWFRGLFNPPGPARPERGNPPPNNRTRQTPFGRPRIGSLPPSARQVTQYPQGVPTGVGGGNAGASRSAPSGSTRPAPAPSGSTRPAPAPSGSTRPAPAPSGSTRPAPAPSTPAASTTPPAAPVTPPPPVPTSPSPDKQLADLRKMRMASQMRQAGQNVVSTQLASFDPFDVVVGHLIDEGYADNYESALGIMSNMSENWRNSILNS